MRFGAPWRALARFDALSCALTRIMYMIIGL
jgi:hypothetical protein